MNYEKMWDILKVESGHRWCQPHPDSMQLLRIRDLMDNIEERIEAKESKNPASTQQPRSEIHCNCICLYCKNDGGKAPCLDCGISYRNFKGRKLSPVR